MKETRWKCNNLADVSLQMYYLAIINACYMHKYAIETTITDVTFLLPHGFSCSTSRIGHVKNYKYTSAYHWRNNPYSIASCAYKPTYIQICICWSINTWLNFSMNCFIPRTMRMYVFEFISIKHFTTTSISDWRYEYHDFITIVWNKAEMLKYWNIYTNIHVYI